jgi:hypothetical protein
MSKQERKRQIRADAEREHPDVDLLDYADARGLSHRGNTTQIGFMAALGMSEDLQFNILRGTLPGGESGIVLHEMRVLTQEDTGGEGQIFGLDYAKQIGGPKRGGFRWDRLMPGRTARRGSSCRARPRSSACPRRPGCSSA